MVAAAPRPRGGVVPTVQEPRDLKFEVDGQLTSGRYEADLGTSELSLLI